MAKSSLIRNFINIHEISVLFFCPFKILIICRDPLPGMANSIIEKMNSENRDYLDYLIQHKINRYFYAIIFSMSRNLYFCK